MKHLLLTTLLATATLPALANHPDSVYVRPDVANGTRNFQIAYSIDKQHWTHVSCNLFESDYGPWGSEKKLYYPVLSYDGKKFYATFIPNPKHPQVATTNSDNFSLWKPQDYPQYSENEFAAILDKQKKAAADNIIKVPYSALQNLLTKKRLADQNRQWESSHFMSDGKSINSNSVSINAQITVNMNDR